MGTDTPTLICRAAYLHQMETQSGRFKRHQVILSEHLRQLGGKIPTAAERKTMQRCRLRRRPTAAKLSRSQVFPCFIKITTDIGCCRNNRWLKHKVFDDNILIRLHCIYPCRIQNSSAGIAGGIQRGATYT